MAYDDFEEDEFLDDEQKEEKYKRDYMANITALKGTVAEDVEGEIMQMHEAVKTRPSGKGALDAELNWNRAKSIIDGGPLNKDPHVAALAADIDKRAGKRGHARELLAKEEGRDSSFFDPTINPNAGRLKE